MPQNTSPSYVPGADEGTAEGLAAPGRAGAGGTNQDYWPIQSIQALYLERCRFRYESLLRGFGAHHRLTRAALLMCQREAGFIISGAYCSGIRGWGNL